MAQSGANQPCYSPVLVKSPAADVPFSRALIKRPSPDAGYGVMAMASGWIPTPIARPARLVAVLIGVTVLESRLAT